MLKIITFLDIVYYFIFSNVNVSVATSVFFTFPFKCPLVLLYIAYLYFECMDYVR